MRYPILILVVGSCLSAGAQESVPELGRSSDAGQDVYEQRITGPAGHASAKRILSVEGVDVPPAYPGGPDSLSAALWQGCNAGMLRSSHSCPSSVAPTFRFVVEADGRVAHGELIGVDGCPDLVEHFYCSMRELARMEPGLVQGKPVRVRMEVPIGTGGASR